MANNYNSIIARGDDTVRVALHNVGEGRFVVEIKVGEGHSAVSESFHFTASQLVSFTSQVAEL